MITLSQRVSEIERRRKTSEPLPTGIAPEISSCLFRERYVGSDPGTKDWRHRLSDESQRREAATLKASASRPAQVPTISLGTARPASKYSPWQSVVISASSVNKHRQSSQAASVSVSMSCGSGEDAYNLDIAMNYGYAAGSPQLLRFVTEHIELLHRPAYEDWKCALTCGTTSALEILFRMLCNRGETVLMENYTYPGVLEALKPLQINAVGIEMDSLGLLPNALDATLKTWNAERGSKPFVLYMIPSGQNPTGATQSMERRRSIYEIAEYHDLLILEDDPYYLLQLTGIRDSSAPDEYLEGLPQSYLSLDRSGRVLRLDATSKILAPGLRCGWLTGSSQLIEKFLNHTEFSTVSPGGPSQLMLYKLLDESWGHEGFIRWLCHLSHQLQQSRDVLISACERYLPSELCRWEVPRFGMFLWMQIDLVHFRQQTKHLVLSVVEIEDLIHVRAKHYGVQVSKGSWFAVSKSQNPTQVYFRMTFAAVDKDMFDEAARRFGRALRDVISSLEIGNVQGSNVDPSLDQQVIE